MKSLKFGEDGIEFEMRLSYDGVVAAAMVTAYFIKNL